MTAGAALGVGVALELDEPVCLVGVGVLMFGPRPSTLFSLEAPREPGPGLENCRAAARAFDLLEQSKYNVSFYCEHEHIICLFYII